MFRRPLFWVLFIAASIGGVYISLKYFSQAFPIVTLDLRMDREGAMAVARQLEERHQFGPAGYQQVPSFGGDQEVQNFVELEAGGREALEKMMREGLYIPFSWTVRHYKENETKETRFRFTPKGDPYGFRVKLPEKEPGAALEAEAARAIAERAATTAWSIDLSKYQLAEKAQEVRPGGRIDHTFVYERPDIKIGEGRYRLRLVVGGDRLTELTHLVKVPEAFNRRYAEMRSANSVISTIDVAALVLLYFIGACGIGLFFLLRQRWVIWRTPVLWGFFISFLQLLAGINQWPLIWMDYDTALSVQGFALREILFLIGSFMGLGIVLSISFMAAESLSRRAFPQHIQQWRLWSTDVAGSKAVLGRTLAGYFLVGLFMAYDVLLYFATSRWLGWWTPSDTLVEPNVLGTYLPWLSAIAVSAQAGFWEESLFRAVPLACAALLGNRFGHRRWWIVGAMLIQALIFGGGHAGYANQPSYARVVELIIPSIGFGLLYLCFGLLTAVVLHYAFDVVWFALPLFVSTAPGIWIDRMLVIILALLPLWIVLAARLRAKKWQEIQEIDRNQAWIPPAPSVVVEVEEKVPVGVLHPAVVRFLPIVGLIGLGMWIFLAKFQTDAPPVAVNRAAAEELGRQVLKEHGIELAAPWKVLSSVEAQPDQEDRFLWQTAGKETYSKFLGQYLPAPHWKVRFARFEGDVAERAEEYQVFIDGTGRVYRYRHQLPEDRPGKSLAENEARAIAHATLQKQYQLDAAAMKEVSAEPSKLKERTDWLFTFADIDKFKLQQGEARLAIKISGDQMTDAYRFVHVPEEWGRAERERRNIPDMLQMVLSVVMVLIVVAGAIGAVVSWSRKKFSAPMFFIMAVLILGLTLMGALNSFSSVTASFRTEQAYKVQVFLFGVTMVLGLLITSACVGLIAGLAAKWQESGTSLPVFTSWLIGISLGTLAAGLNAAAAKLAPSLSPAWAEYSGLSSYVPIANTSLELLSTYLVQSTIAVFIFAVIDKLSIHWTRHRWLCGILFIILGWILAGSSIGSIGSWLAAGAIVGIAYLAAYVFVLRFWLVGLVPIAVATGSILSALRHGMHQAYPQALLGAIIAVLLTAALSWYGFQRLLNKPPQTLSSAEQS